MATSNQTVNQATLPTKTIYCLRSGVPLASVTALCSQGWPLLSTFQASLLHPIYEMPLTKLVLKLSDHLHTAEQIAWCCTDYEQQEIRLCMSAIMYSLDAMYQGHMESKQHIPSLPSWAVAVGTASRLQQLASWYHFITSKRLSFPLYRVSTTNNNAHWENFATWIDDALSVKEEWESGRSELERIEEMRQRNAALLTIKAEHIYKRIDFTKVWNWIEIQISQHASYPAGRRATLKSLFMSGDTSPEDWTTDDVDDLIEAIVTCCDIGNEITHFINTRMNHIRQLIVDFYSSFTLLTTVSSENGATNPDLIQTAEEKEFFATFDTKLDSLASADVIIAEPKRENFASMAHFLKAQAQHRILVRRSALRASNAANNAANSSL